MDWTKAKNIIIAALLITNLILIGSLVGKHLYNEEIQRVEIADTISVMESRNIYFEAKLPEKPGNHPILYVEYDTIDPEKINESIANQAGLGSNEITEASIKQYVVDFLKSASIYSKNLMLQSISNKDGVYYLEYKNMVGKFPLEDSYIKCSVKNGKIENFHRVWLKPLEFGKNKRAVMDVSSALVRFMNALQKEQANGEKITITKMELVYWLDTSAFDLNSPISDTAFPSWKITYNNGKVMHILGYEI